jgi:tetratricopeptide (TPR) repeat protein
MAATETTYGVVSIEERALAEEGDRVFVPLRRELNIAAFGANALHQAKAGEVVVSKHDERGPGADNQEELYVVIQGGATFTIDGDEVDAPNGTAVFVRPGTTREAVATSDATIVLAIGGRAGEAYRIPPGGSLRKFFTLHGEQDYEGAMAACQEVLETYPGNALVLYNIACLESLLGRPDDALATLRTAIEKWPDFQENARTDDDFASIKQDARFEELVA